MGRTLVVGLLLVTAALIQTALLPHVALGGFRPDLLLLLVTIFAVRDGAATGVRIGFVTGLLTDLLLHQSAVGLSVLVHVGVGYTVGIARPYLLPDSLSAPLLLSFMSGFLGTLGFGVLARLLGDERYTGQLLMSASLLVAFFNTMLAPIAVGVVNRIERRFPAEASTASL
jgi:rod shape-determining protein MreD